MPKWRIIIPVVVVALVGVIAYMQLNGGVTIPDSTPVTEQPTDGETDAGPVLDGPLDVTGEEDVAEQADAMIEELLDELDDEEEIAGDGTAELNTMTVGESDADILDVEYYEE